MYSYFNEALYTLLWFGLLALVVVWLLYWLAADLNMGGVEQVLPSLLLYLLLFCWARASFHEAYEARQVVGYIPSTRDTSGQPFFKNRPHYSPCQEPVYAHENRGHYILLLYPLVAAAAAVFYDIARRSRHCLLILGLYLPFVLLTYLFMGFSYLFNSDLKPCSVAIIGGLRKCSYA